MKLPAGIDSEFKDILSESCASTEMFCRTFMPERFYKPFSRAHKEMFNLIDDDSKQLVAIAAPRDFGKTTIFNMAHPAKKIVFQEKNYIIPISATGSSAVEFSENLKLELMSNKWLTEVFGSIKSRDVARDDRAGSFSTLEWVTDTGVKVLPRGAGQQVRGRQWRGDRPDLYIADDMETDEGVMSEEQRDKLRRWWMSAVMGSVEHSSKKWKIVVIGTILHEDSLLKRLLNKDMYPDWHTMRIELCDDNYHSNWPEHMTDEEIRKKAEAFRAAGELDIFYREYRNLVVASENRGFRPEYFKPYSESERELNNNPGIITVILSDPARTMKEGSCMTAVVAVSVDIHTQKVYVRDIVSDHMSPDDLYRQMFEMASRYNALILAPETTGLEEYILWPLKNEMARRNVHYIIVPVKPREAKTGPRRSAGMIPLYRQGLVYHNRSVCGALERYLMTWPRPERWDEIDALSGILYVMEEGQEYFVPLDTKALDVVEAEYEILEYDAPLNYRRVM